MNYLPCVEYICCKWCENLFKLRVHENIIVQIVYKIRSQSLDNEVSFTCKICLVHKKVCKFNLGVLEHYNFC